MPLPNRLSASVCVAPISSCLCPSSCCAACSVCPWQSPLRAFPSLPTGNTHPFKELSHVVPSGCSLIPFLPGSQKVRHRHFLLDSPPAESTVVCDSFTVPVSQKYLINKTRPSEPEEESQLPDISSVMCQHTQYQQNRFSSDSSRARDSRVTNNVGFVPGIDPSSRGVTPAASSFEDGMTRVTIKQQECDSQPSLLNYCSTAAETNPTFIPLRR